MPVRAQATISGRVQGVGFRHNTRQEAGKHELTGWVRNNPDGTVEAVFEGEESAVKEMLRWCQQGPRTARVDAVRVLWQPADSEFSVFEIR